MSQAGHPNNGVGPLQPAWKAENHAGTCSFRAAQASSGGIDCASFPAFVRRQTTRLAAFVAVVAGLSALAPSAVGAQEHPALLRSKAKALRDHNALLASRSNAAVVGLFAFDSRLDRARGRLAALEARLRSLERQRARDRNRLRAAQRAVAQLRSGLARRVRALYEQDANEPLAVVLAARSLEAARAGIETLGRTASANRRLLDAIRSQQALIARLRRQSASRAAARRRLAAAARRTSASIAAARRERARYVDWLVAARRTRLAEMSSLESDARALETRAQAVTARSALPNGFVPIDVGAPSEYPSHAGLPAVPPTGARLLTVSATAYSLPGRTASGMPVGPGVVAVDPAVIPLGTRLTIPGYGSGIAADTGLAVRGATIDLWFPTVTQALAWGRRTVTIAVH